MWTAPFDDSQNAVSWKGGFFNTSSRASHLVNREVGLFLEKSAGNYAGPRSSSLSSGTSFDLLNFQGTMRNARWLLGVVNSPCRFCLAFNFIMKVNTCAYHPFCYWNHMTRGVSVRLYKLSRYVTALSVLTISPSSICFTPSSFMRALN